MVNIILQDGTFGDMRSDGLQTNEEFARQINEVGAVGEERFRNWAKDTNIIDVTKDSNFYSPDVDFLILHNNSIIAIDVKTDELIDKTGNIVFETHNCRSEGWSLRTWSNYIYYTSKNDPSLTYWIDMKKFRQYIKNTYKGEVKQFNGGRSSGYVISANALIFFGVAQIINNNTSINDLLMSDDVA